MPWQQRIVGRAIRPFLRGLVHSDGCRSLNTVRAGGREYAYQRYLFTNRSDDISEIFRGACHALGVEARRMNWCTMSVNRRADVAALDEFIGAKT